MRQFAACILTLALFLVTACAGGEGDAAASAVGGEGPPSATAGSGASTEIVMTVPSMSCPLCVRSIRVRLEEAGLEDVRIDLDTKLVRARFDPTRTDARAIEALVDGRGFPVQESRIVPSGGEEGAR